jgi:predicted metal-dependent enzyme (double-stranded beta helix superfamily)
MVESPLQSFIDTCRACADRHPEPADAVSAIAPHMHALLETAGSFLKPEHLRADPAHYARNAIYIAPDSSLSLFAIVWTPGQWTPIHDHGSWGVVGVLRGILHERSFIRTDVDRGRDEDIDLHRGGVLLLTPGTVTSFVPNPDHIHITGVPEDAPPVVSLHLYGRNMDSFHIYDVATRSRQRVNVEHNES